ncbi:hypothetical protein Tco_1553550 [Tanacetum coccineum]
MIIGPSVPSSSPRGGKEIVVSEEKLWGLCKIEELSGFRSDPVLVFENPFSKLEKDRSYPVISSIDPWDFFDFSLFSYEIFGGLSITLLDGDVSPLDP